MFKVNIVHFTRNTKCHWSDISRNSYFRILAVHSPHSYFQ